MVIKTIKAEELKKRLDRGEIFLIDVRETAEYRTGYIDGSRSLPLGKISREKLPSKPGSIVIYCRSGKRSSEACQRLLKQDSHLDIGSLEGGILAWEQAGFNVKKFSKSKVSIDRQAQLVSGLLIFSGTVTSVLMGPQFCIIPGLIGLGLMFAGITGWCGLVKLLAKMPWNQ
jgi:rhodanese-related sulfurtransferase